MLLNLHYGNGDLAVLNCVSVFLNNAINREASDKTKGFRLQKLRALKLMLETLEQQDTVSFYTAIEDVEDVSHTSHSSDDIQKYYEEDKNYDPDKSFTVFTSCVKNTLVSFFDIFVHTWKSSEQIKLGFYTTASIGKEKKTLIVNQTEVALPKDPILKSLSSDDAISDDVAAVVHKVLLEEYKEQYSKKPGKGYLQTLENIDLSDFKKFLQQISWHFGEVDEQVLKQEVIELIKASKLHNARHENKEETIFAILMELLDSKQNAPSLALKVVHASDVKYEFKKAESEGDDGIADPTWSQLKQLETEIVDKRNLAEKITSVCPEYAAEKLKHLARLACRSKTEQESHGKSFLSLKYRAYEACSNFFFNNKTSISTEAEVDALIKELQVHANQNVNTLKEEYHYPVCNSHAVDGLVMDLIDSCFISFDEDKK